MRTVQSGSKARVAILAAVVSMVVASGCGGPRAFTQGQYSDPEEIAMLDDKWNQNDMQLVAKTVINSMEAWVGTAGIAGKPVVILEQPKNRTAEHIDMGALYDHVKTSLINSGRFTFLDKAARQDIAGELEYQDSGYVDSAEAIARGKQKAAQFFLGGVITSNVQQVGKQKSVYYKATFELTDIETTEILWTDHKEIVKKFQKKSIGF
jgi:uncharacterized protein (TIGR02722 family)